MKIKNGQNSKTIQQQFDDFDRDECLKKRKTRMVEKISPTNALYITFWLTSNERIRISNQPVKVRKLESKVWDKLNGLNVEKLANNESITAGTCVVSVKY